MSKEITKLVEGKTGTRAEPSEITQVVQRIVKKEVKAELKEVISSINELKGLVEIALNDGGSG